MELKILYASDMSSCIDDMKKCTQNLGWEARSKFITYKAWSFMRE